jgi:hypothetical protein
MKLFQTEGERRKTSSHQHEGTSRNPSVNQHYQNSPLLYPCHSSPLEKKVVDKLVFVMALADVGLF